jgi:hypothetical protein
LNCGNLFAATIIRARAVPLACPDARGGKSSYYCNSRFRAKTRQSKRRRYGVKGQRNSRFRIPANGLAADHRADRDFFRRRLAARGGLNLVIAHRNSPGKITILRRKKLCYHPSVTGHCKSGLARSALLIQLLTILKALTPDVSNPLIRTVYFVIAHQEH